MTPARPVEPCTTVSSTAPRAPARPQRLWRHRLAAGACALLLAGLQACGGGSEGDAEAPPPAAALPSLQGRVSNGATPTAVGSLQITVKGRVGTARTAEGRLAPVDGSDYLASLDQLSGPYLLSDSAASSEPGGLYSVALAAGTANLTPLTTLVVAQLLATEPQPYFAALGSRGGFEAADAASVATAQQRVRRWLQREYGFELPATLGDFITTPFNRTAGDPMFDTLQALVARIGTQGSVAAVVSALAQEAARCRGERVLVRSGSVEDEFCPLTKVNAADADDASVRALGFTNRHGDVLTLRLRGTVVVDLQLATAEGSVARCSGSACNGVTVGTPAGDRTQDIGLAGTVLSAGSGTLTLSGSLRTAIPGIELPALACTTNRFYLIDEAALTAAGWCTSPDEFGLGASGFSQASGSTRRTYTFSDGAGGPSIELVLQGDTVLRALVYTTDPDTGLPVARYQCRDGGCSRITVGPATTDTSLGVPVVLRPIRLERAVLPAVLADGSLSTTASITVDGSFTGYHVNDPSALPLLPVACAAGAPVTTATTSESATPVTVCDPDDAQGFQLRSTSLDADGNLVFSAAGLLSDGAGSFASGNSVVVALTPGGTVAYAFFDAFNGPRYACSGSACSGITVGMPDANGERTVQFSATTLREQGTAGLPADRTVGLAGGFIAPFGP